MNDYAAISTFAEELADVARRIAREHFRSTTAFDLKADSSPVTVADKAIERALRADIEERFPEHGIFGEETGRTEGDGRIWVLDPIDGTKSFITGMPLFGALIAFVEQDRPQLGIIEMPALKERWSASQGVTAFAGRPCRTSDCKTLADARVHTASPDIFTGQDWERYERMSRQAAIRRFGGDCYQYGLLASGFCDVVVEASLMPYDYMALVPVVEGAGGCITDWEGRPLDFNSDGRVAAAASKALHAETLEYLSGNA
ncbi:histidinol-phosphatase [Hyphomicrobium sp.]|uniref:histidinol-phosphatase n=1 Tax=Hyphomicrobium sp. TaxID=82 RepID=UPI002E364AA8|nr:histidinol-phosphatase [Hyphomicrobium sp.]HEX2840860.1 histidinol-phosphatase [Hyphomicrobium sp.]